MLVGVLHFLLFKKRKVEELPFHASYFQKKENKSERGGVLNPEESLFKKINVVKKLALTSARENKTGFLKKSSFCS